MNTADLFIGGIALFLLGLSAMNPGGAAAAFIIITILVVLRYGLPFVRDLVLTRHQGAKGRKAKQKASRAVDKQRDGGDGRNGGGR